jgi:sulfide:quinone oxidoreductase
MTHARSRILIAGGGVGALEAALALQALAADRVDIALLAPDRHFTYRALSVSEPFGLGTAVQYELRAIAQDRGFDLIRDALDTVDPDRREVVTQDRAVIAYDRLVLALGARPRAAVAGAVTFRGPQDAARTGLALATMAGSAGHVVFAAPDSAG